MQDIMCYSGQEKVFEQASETIERLLLIEVNSKQIERLCHHYGQRLEDEQSQSIESGAEAKSTAGAHYVMVDGSLIFTRQEGWKEIKLGRVFAQDSSIEINKGRHQIQSS